MQGATTALVKSVAGRTGAVVLTADDVGDGTTNKAYSAADKTKLAGIAAGATVGATAATISDASAAGRSVLTAADAAAQRTALGLGTAAVKAAGATTGANSGELVQAGTGGAITAPTVYVTTLGVGTTTPASSGTTGGATVEFRNSGYIQFICSSSSSAGGFALRNSSGYQYELQSDPGGSFLFYDRSAGAYRFAIDSNGHVGFNNQFPAESIDCVGNIKASGTISPGTYTVGTLPTPGTARRIAYASNARNAGEGSGAGTGSIVVDNGTNWRIPGATSAVAA